MADGADTEAAEGRSCGTLGTAAYMIVCGESVAGSASGASWMACWFLALRRMARMRKRAKA